MARPIYGQEHFPELSIQALLALGRAQVPDFDRWLPDNVRPCDIERPYLMLLVNSLVPDSVETIRQQCLQRVRARQANQQGNQIRLAQQFQDLFNGGNIGAGLSQRLLARLEHRHQ